MNAGGKTTSDSNAAADMIVAAPHKAELTALYWDSTGTLRQKCSQAVYRFQES